MRRRRPGAGAAVRVGLGVLALLLVACGAEVPRDVRPGLYVTGTLAGRQVAVSDGSPRLFTGNCHPAAGQSDDVCFISRDIDGELFVLLLRDPGALSAGTLDAAAVVQVRVGGQKPVAATGGEVVLDEAGDDRYVGTLRVRFPGGALNGTFDVGS